MRDVKKIKLSFSQTCTKFGQFLYLSFKYSSHNLLWESASACSYSFIFSFIPVVLIIFTVLVQILKVSPGMLDYVLDFCNQFSDVYDFTPILDNIIKIKSFGFFDIILAIWIIWMARKLFLSIVQGMYRIFRSAASRKGYANQIFTFISEFAIVLLFIFVILASFIFNKFLELPVFLIIKNTFPKVFRTSSNVLVSSVMYSMFFIFALYCYKILSGTKPKWRICIFYAFVCSAVTFIISFFINKFMRFSNYNVVYGTISTLLVLLFKVYMFFVVFLFSAQMVYVSQFFESLIIAYMYSSQNTPSNLINDFMIQHLFGNPSLYKLEPEIRTLENGNVVYSVGESSDFVYLILKGTVLEEKNEVTKEYSKGDFFGEISVFINSERISTATATSDCELLLIKSSEFLEIIRKNQQASTKALERLNHFTRQ